MFHRAVGPERDVEIVRDQAGERSECLQIGERAGERLPTEAVACRQLETLTASASSTSRREWLPPTRAHCILSLAHEYRHHSLSDVWW